jgi:hypothetical protein
MTTGKEKLSRVFLLYLCLQNTEFVEQIKDSKKRKSKTSATYKFNIDKIKSWYKIIEWTLSLDCWLRNDEHDKGYFETMTAESKSHAQIHIQEYMKLFKSTVKRTKGTGMLLTKFHHLLHIRDEVFHTNTVPIGRLLVMQISPPIRHQTPQMLILSCRALAN